MKKISFDGKKYRYFAEFVADDKGKLMHPKELKGVNKRTYYQSGLSEYRMERATYYERIVCGHAIISVLMLETSTDVFVEIIKNAKLKGYTYIPLVSDAKNGVLHFYNNVLRKDPVQEMMIELGIYDEFMKIPVKKRLNRLTKFMGKLNIINHKPVIAFTSGGTGYVVAKESWATSNNIEHGAKLVGSMKSIVIVLPDPDFIRYAELALIDSPETIDMIVPEDENKFKLKKESLSTSIFTNSELDARKRFSRNLIRGLDDMGKEIVGKSPTYSLQIRAICNSITERDFTKIVNFYQKGEYDSELLYSLFGYRDSNGLKTYNIIGKKIIGGENIAPLHPHHPSIWPDVDKAIGVYVQKMFAGKIPGIYGTALPLSMLPWTEEKKIKLGWVFRPPIMIPTYGRYAIYKHCIYVDDSMWDQLFHGDYDGDLAFVIHRKALKSPANWITNKETLTQWATAPSKEDSSIDMIPEAAVADVIEQARYCGIVHNNAKIVVDMGRVLGMNINQSLKLSMLLDMKYVQPTIDAFKHTTGKEMAKIVTMINELKKEVKTGITDPEKDKIAFAAFINRMSIIYRAVNGRGVTFTFMLSVIKDMKVSKDSKSFFERVLATIPTIEPINSMPSSYLILAKDDTKRQELEAIRKATIGEFCTQITSILKGGYVDYIFVDDKKHFENIIKDITAANVIELK